MGEVFSFDFDVDGFIADIKNENPKVIIVSDERKHWVTDATQL